MNRQTLYPTQAMVPQNEFRQSLIYNEFCRPLYVEHGAGAFLSADGPWGLRFSLQRTKSQGEFTDIDIALLQQLVDDVIAWPEEITNPKLPRAQTKRRCSVCVLDTPSYACAEGRVASICSAVT